MTDRQSGLRFDIYERVHLAEDTVGVRELDEVELVPHIQVYTEHEQALLKGHLYLTGFYSGETGDGQRTLEHLIPVEITLPLNRIQDVSQVSVDVENFDVDLISPRNLNVTGVLTLHGVEMLTSPDDSWRDSEETVFVHEAESYGDISFGQGAASENSAAFPEPSNTTQPAFRQDWSAQQAWSSGAGEAWRAEARESGWQAQETVSEMYVQADEEDEFNEWIAEEKEIAPVSGSPAPSPALEAPLANQQEESQQELKIAFNSKSAPESSYHLKSLIQTEEYREEPALAGPNEEAPTPRTDALEWKRLFSRTENEGQKFSRVRLCIVQKEETLDAIAERYNVNPREILLYNRLTEPAVEEGDVLIIPK